MNCKLPIPSPSRVPFLSKRSSLRALSAVAAFRSSEAAFTIVGAGFIVRYGWVGVPPAITTGNAASRSSVLMVFMVL